MSNFPHNSSQAEMLAQDAHVFHFIKEKRDIENILWNPLISKCFQLMFFFSPAVFKLNKTSLLAICNLQDAGLFFLAQRFAGPSRDTEK